MSSKRGIQQGEQMSDDEKETQFIKGILYEVDQRGFTCARAKTFPKRWVALKNFYTTEVRIKKDSLTILIKKENKKCLAYEHMAITDIETGSPKWQLVRVQHMSYNPSPSKRFYPHTNYSSTLAEIAVQVEIINTETQAIKEIIERFMQGDVKDES